MMEQVKSVEEFDYFLAVHQATGQFVKLDFGLTPPMDPHADKNQQFCCNGTLKEPHSQDWKNTDRTSLKSFITIGAFLTSN